MKLYSTPVISATVVALLGGGLEYPGGAKEQRDSELRRVAVANFSRTDSARLMQLARTNPMAAGVLQQFAAGDGAAYSSIRNGKLAYRGIPTMETVLLRQRRSRDGDAYAASMKPIPSGTYAQVRWSSRPAQGGDLEVTFESLLVDGEEDAGRLLYPSVNAVISGTSPSRLLRWRLAG